MLKARIRYISDSCPNEYPEHELNFEVFHHLIEDSWYHTLLNCFMEKIRCSWGREKETIGFLVLFEHSVLPVAVNCNLVVQVVAVEQAV